MQYVYFMQLTLSSVAEVKTCSTSQTKGHSPPLSPLPFPTLELQFKGGGGSGHSWPSGNWTLRDKVTVTYLQVTTLMVIWEYIR